MTNQLKLRPERQLSPLDASCILIGVVIGIGVFKAPSVVALNSSNEWMFLGLWLVGGLLSLVGALCYAELGASHPQLGGEYHFLREAFGRKIAYLFGWGRLAVIQTGAIATVAFVLGDYTSRILPLGKYGASIYAALSIAALTFLNVRGLKPAKWFQNSLTFLTLFLILCLITFGLFSSSEPSPLPTTPSPSPSLGAAMIFILLTFGGWNEAVYLASELKDVKKNLVKSLVFGLVIVTVFYFLLNVAYLKVLGFKGIQSSEVVAADMLSVLIGPKAALIVSTLIALASLSTLNATLFTGSRTHIAFGRDFPAFRWLGHWDSATHSPHHALWGQGLVALALVGVGAWTRQGFVTMVEYTAPVFWLFFFLTSVSLFILRARAPRQSSYQVPLYPVLPLIFSFSCLYMLYSSLNYTGYGALFGVVMLLLGIPIPLFSKLKRRPLPSGQNPIP